MSTSDWGVCRIEKLVRYPSALPYQSRSRPAPATGLVFPSCGIENTAKIQKLTFLLKMECRRHTLIKTTLIKNPYDVPKNMDN
uniref:Uncharacterized protein n=1 Tax=Romanomermis culicivorax TaxID=13658 RepID=A0A915HHU8_ROMCU